MSEEMISSSSGEDTGSTATMEPESSRSLPTQESDKWESDKRFETMWKKDPNALYKSYREMEKTYTPKEKISQYEKDLQELRSYKEQNGQIVDYVTSLAQHPEYSKHLTEFVQRIEQEMTQKKYGDLAPEVIDRLKKGEDAFNRLETIEQEKAREEKTHAYVEKFSEISRFCEENNISWTDEERQAFVEHAKQEGVSTPKELLAVFYERAIPMLKSSALQTGEKGVLKTLKEQRNSALPSSRTTRRSNAPAGKPTLDQMLDKILGE